MNRTIEFTNEECRAIRQLIDLALKNPIAGGLNVSKAANYLADKFADPTPPEEVEDEDVEDAS